jgi:hypothetical protein
MTCQNDSHEFHLNGLKKYLIGVAISLTTALICQSTALVWWAGKVDTRLQYCEKHLDVLTISVHEMETRPVSHP